MAQTLYVSVSFPVEADSDNLTDAAVSAIKERMREMANMSNDDLRLYVEVWDREED